MPPNIFTIIIAVFPFHIKMWIILHEPNRKCQITMRFTGQSRTVDPQYGIHFMLPYWHLEYKGGS